MNILDEQILENQRQLLRSWRIPVRQIGYDVGRKGLKDKEISRFSDQSESTKFAPKVTKKWWVEIFYTQIL